MAEIMERIGELAEEIGNLEEKTKIKLQALQLLPGQVPMTMDEAAKVTEVQMPREMYVYLTDYWASNGNLALKRELLDALKTEARRFMTMTEERESGGARRGGGIGRGGEGGAWN